MKTTTRTGNSSSSNMTSLPFKSEITLSATSMRITTPLPVKSEITLSISTMMTITPPTTSSLITTVPFSDSLTPKSTVPIAFYYYSVIAYQFQKREYYNHNCVQTHNKRQQQSKTEHSM